MRRLFAALAWLCLALAPCPWALAAPPAQAPSAPGASEFLKLRDSVDKTVALDAPAASLPPELVAQDLKSYAEHLHWQRQFARDSWEWHLFSTRMLMFVVLAIVACGLWFTYLQFTKELKTVRTRTPAKPPPEAAPAEADPQAVKVTTMKFGPGGVEITSQVIGLLVLAFSLAFFYLYVKEVYPMQEANLQQQASSANATAPVSTPAPAAK